MLSVPSAAEPLLMSFSIAFAQPTFQRILLLCVGVILTRGRRTATGVQRYLRHPTIACSVHTIRSYRFDLGALCRSLDARGADVASI